jgi:hypothetical protein
MKPVALLFVVFFCTGASCERSVSDPCAPNNLIKGRSYHEGNLVISETQTLPAYLEKVTIQSEGATFYYRSGEMTQLDGHGHLTTPWLHTNTSEIEGRALKGKVAQFAVSERQFPLLRQVTWKFETTLSRYLGDKWVPREDWCARAPKQGIDEWKRDWNVFAIHHTAGTNQSSTQTVRGIQNFHMDERRWSDIAYHFLIGNDGKIYEGRSLLFQGADVKGHNDYTIGLVALGCYDSSACGTSSTGKMAHVTTPLLDSFGKLTGLLAYLERSHVQTLSRQNVDGHREFQGASTVCPGNLIMNKLDDIIAIAEATRQRLPETL